MKYFIDTINAAWSWLYPESPPEAQPETPAKAAPERTTPLITILSTQSAGYDTTNKDRIPPFPCGGGTAWALTKQLTNLSVEQTTIFPHRDRKLRLPEIAIINNIRDQSYIFITGHGQAASDKLSGEYINNTKTVKEEINVNYDDYADFIAHSKNLHAGDTVYIILWSCYGGAEGQFSSAAALADSLMDKKRINSVILASISPIPRFDGQFRAPEIAHQCLEFRAPDIDNILFFHRTAEGLRLYKTDKPIYLHREGITFGPKLPANLQPLDQRLPTVAREIKVSEKISVKVLSRLLRENQLLPSTTAKTAQGVLRPLQMSQSKIHTPPTQMTMAVQSTQRNVITKAPNFDWRYNMLFQVIQFRSPEEMKKIIKEDVPKLFQDAKGAQLELSDALAKFIDLSITKKDWDKLSADHKKLFTDIILECGKAEDVAAKRDETVTPATSSGSAEKPTHEDVSSSNQQSTSDDKNAYGRKV